MIKIISRERPPSNGLAFQSPKTSRTRSSERVIRASTCSRDGNRSVLFVVYPAGKPVRGPERDNLTVHASDIQRLGDLSTGQHPRLRPPLADPIHPGVASLERCPALLLEPAPPVFGNMPNVKRDSCPPAVEAAGEKETARTDGQS